MSSSATDHTTPVAILKITSPTHGSIRAVVDVQVNGSLKRLGDKAILAAWEGGTR